MFLLKKIIGPLMYPLTLCFLVMAVGLVMMWFTRRQKAGKVIVSAGAVLLLLFSYSGFSGLIARPLEYRYPPLVALEGLSEVRWVVVLGGGAVPDPGQPANSQLVGSSLARLVEGVRIHRALPGTKLVLSGESVFDPVSPAELMAQAAELIGVEKDRMVVESRSRDTEEQARLVGRIVGKEPFVLVTSASHMPRSMALFERQGMRPLAAPADYMVRKGDAGLSPGMFFPGAGSIAMAGIAVHEWVGLAWAKLRGRI